MDDQRVTHMRRMLAHGERQVTRRQERESDLDRGARAFFDFLRSHDAASAINRRKTHLPAR